MGKGINSRRRWRGIFAGKSLGWAMVAAIAAMVTVLLHAPRLQANQPVLYPSPYASSMQAPFNQPAHYPNSVTPPSGNYRPAADWFGLLILPTEDQYRQVAKSSGETDWAWFQVQAAPASAKNLIGQTIRLAWSQTPQTQLYVDKASRDVRFTPEAEKTLKQGVIHPIRLNGRDRVGPIQSLAGGHPFDDVTALLVGSVQVENSSGVASPAPAPTFPAPSTPPTTAPVTLRINREPIMATGRFTALVKFLEAVPPKAPNTLPQKCPGDPPCASEWIKVQHYNPQSGQFDGDQEVIRIPQQLPASNGVFNMTTRDLPQSPAGVDGWYIYGANDTDGVFTVQALEPRSLFRLPAQQTVLGFNEGLKYIQFGNWKDLASRKGTLQTVRVDASGANPQVTANGWRVGDRFLVMHNYGGRGGSLPSSEKFILGTYAGHFSFGYGEVIRDPFTGEPRLNYNYLQVYGNGTDGVLSGGNTLSNYMGSLQRGLFATRPFSDTLIKFEPLTEDYNFGGTRLSFYDELIAELYLMGARYRIGDGSGNATITSATSCVQDSSQALFLTLVRFRDKILADPQIVQWMKEHPQDPNTLRFQELVRLSKELAEQLTPLGVVRWDWKDNANVLTGVEQENQFISIDNFQLKNLATGLISWRTAMPRQAHDEYAMLFLRHGAHLWFLRPNQIGGNDPTIAPLEPTLLLGAWKTPILGTPTLAYLVIRTFGGVSIPTAMDWLKTLGILAGFAAIAVPYGFFTGFLRQQRWLAPWYRQGLTLVRLLIVPALLQEYVFRVLMIPYPKVWIPSDLWLLRALLALGLFVGFQWVYGRWIRKSLFPVLGSAPFLVLATLLGIASTLTYYLTGSLWTITILHWVVVSVWWLFLGGRGRMVGGE